MPRFLKGRDSLAVLLYREHTKKNKTVRQLADENGLRVVDVRKRLRVISLLMNPKLRAEAYDYAHTA